MHIADQGTQHACNAVHMLGSSWLHCRTHCSCLDCVSCITCSAKLTKLPTHKAAKKQLTENLKELVSEIKDKDKKGKGKAAAGKQEPPAGGDGEMMTD